MKLTPRENKIKTFLKRKCKGIDLTTTKRRHFAAAVVAAATGFVTGAVVVVTAVVIVIVSLELYRYRFV